MPSHVSPSESSELRARFRPRSISGANSQKKSDLRWILGLLALAFLLNACAQGNCRSQCKEDPNRAVLILHENEERMEIFKYNGSRQCMSFPNTISPEAMKEELKGIEVYSAEVRQDNLLHLQSCGSPTGQANVLTIKKRDWPIAREAGFRQWLWSNQQNWSTMGFQYETNRIRWVKDSHPGHIQFIEIPKL